MAQFNVLLPENLKEKLQKEKDKTGQSIASLIRTAIIEYFERRGK